MPVAIVHTAATPSQRRKIRAGELWADVRDENGREETDAHGLARGEAEPEDQLLGYAVQERPEGE